MINIIEGNILEAKENIICHQVNCQGVMGAGLAKQIRNKYPEVYESYKQFYEMFKGKKKQLLGNAQVVNCNDGKIIANIFGQFGYGKNGIQTDYDALRSGFNDIFSAVTNISKYKDKTIAIPYGIGCGLDGGDWNIVYKMIEDISEYYNYDCTIYKLIKEK